jgi:presenilin-like A22 family membrane protease
MELNRLVPLLGMPLMLIAVQVGAILLALPLQTAGVRAFENPESPANPLIFIVILLVFTGFMLALIRYRFRKVIGIVIGVSIFFTFIYIFGAILNQFLADAFAILVASVIISGAAVALLYRFPEWYVIDSLGLLIAAGAASIFGISLEIFPVLILLALLAVYDAISVYKTRHMITLAEGVLDMKTPILFIIPKRRDYSFRREGIGPIGEGERSAFVMGMGDLIMPSILVVSANTYLRAPMIGFLTIPALGAIIGSLAGLSVLLVFVNRGSPQAGLPPLNGGAIAGFLIAWFLTGL